MAQKHPPITNIAIPLENFVPVCMTDTCYIDTATLGAWPVLVKRMKYAEKDRNHKDVIAKEEESFNASVSLNSMYVCKGMYKLYSVIHVGREKREVPTYISEYCSGHLTSVFNGLSDFVTPDNKLTKKFAQVLVDWIKGLAAIHEAGMFHGRIDPYSLMVSTEATGVHRGKLYGPLGDIENVCELRKESYDFNQLVKTIKNVLQQNGVPNHAHLNSFLDFLSWAQHPMEYAYNLRSHPLFLTPLQQMGSLANAQFLYGGLDKERKALFQRGLNRAALFYGFPQNWMTKARANGLGHFLDYAEDIGPGYRDGILHFFRFARNVAIHHREQEASMKGAYQALNKVYPGFFDMLYCALCCLKYKDSIIE